MSVRIRLLISYIVMLIIPLLLLPLVAAVIGFAYIGDVQEFYQLDFTNASFRRLIQDDLLTFEEIKTTAFKNPDKLMDTTYLAQLDQKLSPSQTGLVVRKGSTVIYSSSRLNKNDVENRLPDFAYYRGEDDRHGRHHQNWLDHDDRFSLRQFDFYFADHSPGSVFLVTNVGPIERFAQKFFWPLLLALLLILIITSGLLTYIVARSIARPIESLTEAANQIKEGNLDFAVENSSPDEIGQLYHAFEEMRCRLKASVELRLQYEDNRKELITNISHDLKTPVTAIKGYTEGIIDGVAASPEKMEKYIRTIYTKAEDMDRLIDELLLYSTLDIGKEPFNFERVDIKRYLQDSAEELQLDLEKKNIELALLMDDEEEPLLVIADREKIKRVICNIVENAAKYMDKVDGRISLSLQETDAEVLIDISDNGPGIPAPSLPHVFERFYQGDPARTRGGSGLGLAIAKRIIEEHGGQIWVQRSDSAGSSICFSLKKAGR